MKKVLYRGQIIEVESKDVFRQYACCDCGCGYTEKVYIYDGVEIDPSECCGIVETVETYENIDNNTAL